MIGAVLHLAGRVVSWMVHGSHPTPGHIDPATAEIVRRVQAGELTCQICGHWHPEDALEVIHLPIVGLEIYFPADRRNLRHCTRPECLQRARAMRMESFSVIPQEEEPL